MPRSHSGDLSDSDSPNPAASALVNRAYTLFDSLESLQSYLRRHSLLKEVEIRPFATSLRSELRSLESLAATPPTPPTAHALRSSNLPYLEAVWSCARAQVGVRGICKSFSYLDKEGVPTGGGGGGGGKGKRGSVSVDVVAENGLVWIKVSTVTPERILHSLAKGGWEDAEDEMGLVKCVRSLVSAAKSYRVQYLHPSVLVYLPGVPDVGGAGAGIDRFVRALLGEGARVRLGSSERILSPKGEEEGGEVEDMVKPFVNISSIVNLDVTILLALVSDITHGPVPLEERFHPAILRQLELEASGRRMGEEIYPVLDGREMVATVTARKRFVEIVDIIGSASERERARMVLEGEAKDGEWGGLSGYGHGGRTLKLPVRVVEDDFSPEGPVQERVVGKLSTVNRAVFVTGWKKGHTTITSNRTVAKTIEGLVEDGETGPDMFVLSMGRSLVGKAKRIDV